MTTAERVTAILSVELGVDADQVTPEALIAKDLGGDSIDRCEIAMSLEWEFEVQINDRETFNAQTVSDYIRLIEGKIST